MRASSVSSTLALTLYCLLMSCQAATQTPTDSIPDDVSHSRDQSSLSEHRAVIVFHASLRASPGRGRLYGTIQPDTVVILGDEREGWRFVQITQPLRAQGWVQSERIGCRILSDSELTPLDRRRPEVKLRPGALVAIFNERDDTIEVETQGSISVRGFIKKANCGVGSRFIPTLPRDGIAHRLVRKSRLSAEIDGGRTIELDEGQRFAVFTSERHLAYGRTDGPVVVRGSIDATALVRDKTTPFDRLAEPLGYTHEALVEVKLCPNTQLTPEPIATLPGGTPLNVLKHRGDWTRVRTYGQVQLEGWLRKNQIRRVSLDYNKLDPYARRRDHAPLSHDLPRGMELLDKNQE